MKLSKKTIIIASIVAAIIAIVAYWYWVKNRTVNYYYRHFKIDDMSHDELVAANLNMEDYSWSFDETVRATNKPEFDAMTDDALRKELRSNIADLMNAAYSGK